MKLYVKNKLVSIGEGSKVLDEEGNAAFVVKGCIFTMTKKKKIYDLEGNLIFKVRNKFWHLLKKSAFIKDPKGHTLMQLKEKQAIVNKGFDVLKTDDTYNIEWGGFASGRNNIYRDEDLICTMQRKVWSLVDSFELDFPNVEDGALLVAMAVAIDLIYDAQSD